MFGVALYTYSTENYFYIYNINTVCFHQAPIAQLVERGTSSFSEMPRSTVQIRVRALSFLVFFPMT